MNGKYLFASVFFVFFLSLPRPVFAQEGGPLVHRLSWQPVEYVSRYEVTVEARARTNAWIEVFRKTTERETFAECPLFVGSYRFRVGVYDLLGNFASAADWVYFEVKASREEAVPPAVEPEASREQTGQDTARALQVAEETRQSAEEARQKLTEIYQSVEEIQKEMEQLKPPAERTPAPEEKERSGFTLEIIAQPFVVLPFSDFNEIYATSPIQPLGFGLRFSLLPFDTPLGVFGLELNPSWNFLANDVLITSRNTHIFTAHLSLVWQIQPFGRNTGIKIRAGGGISYMKARFDFNNGGSTAYLNAWNPVAAGGVSFFILLTETIFVNAGLDYLHIFTRDNIALNYLRPSLSLGFWF